MATAEDLLANNSGNCEQQGAVDWSVLDALAVIQKPGTQDLCELYEAISQVLTAADGRDQRCDNCLGQPIIDNVRPYPENHLPDDRGD
jgi:hypothetical protein